MSDTINTARQLAALKRRTAAGLTTCAETTTGLASVRAVKIQEKSEELTRKESNRMKTMEIIKWIQEVESATQVENWAKSIDWTKISEKTLHKCIPFQEMSLKISEILKDITDCITNIAKSTVTYLPKDIPVSNMTRTQLCTKHQFDAKGPFNCTIKIFIRQANAVPNKNLGGICHGPFI